MKQRIVAIVIVSAALITAIGCGNKAAEAPVAEEAEVVAEVTEAVEEVAEDTAETEEVAEEVTEEVAQEVAEETPAQETATEEVATEETTEEAPAEESKPAEEAKPVETKPALTIPDWFDAAYYAANNADVVAALGSSPEALYNHYTAYGKGEGRAAYEGDPNAVAKAESPAPAGEPAQTEGSAASSDGCPWQLYTLFGEGLDSYFYAPAYWTLSDEDKARVDSLQVEMCNRYNNATGADWTKAGDWNGVMIVKWFPG